MRRHKHHTTGAVVHLSHKIALDPTCEQEAYFKRACGTSRFTWNWALAEWNRQYEAGLQPTAYALKKAFNSIKYREYPWLEGMHRDAHAEPFSNLGKAWARFFRNLKEGKKAHQPRFKKKGRCRDSFSVANDKFRVNGKTVGLPIIGDVRMREELRFQGTILGATVSRSSDRWFAPLQVEMPLHKARRKRMGAGVEGADLGITSAVVLSTGEEMKAPMPLRGLLRRLKIRSRDVSRKLETAKVAVGIKRGSPMPKGTRLPVSNNGKKTSSALATLYYRIANVRSDFTHKSTNRLCRENQAVGIEDLNVAGMLRNEKLARALSDVGFGQFRWQMQYKGILYGTRVVLADRWYPSSKRCSECGYIFDGLTLKDREWPCSHCGAHHDRNVNAARNLKRLATATALPVASSAAMPSTDVAHAVSGGKVTPVIYDFRPQEGSGQEDGCAHFRAQLE